MSPLATDGTHFPLDAQIEQYLAHLVVERGLSANTLLAYRRDLGRYREYLLGQGIERAQDVTSVDVSGFVAALAAGTGGSAGRPSGSGADGSGRSGGAAESGRAALAASSISRIVSAVRGFHRFMLVEQVCASDPAHDVKPQVPTRRLPKALTVEQVLAMIEAPGTDEPVGIRDRALLEFLYATGARVSEVLDLDVDDIDLESPIIRLTGKGNKQRIVPVGSHARDALGTYLVRSRPALAAGSGGGRGALFLNQRGNRLSRQSAWLVMRTAAQRAKIETPVSPHVLRHSFATHLLDGGADVRVVQELLGHASVTTTQIYTLVTIDRLREVYAVSHPRAR